MTHSGDDRKVRGSDGKVYDRVKQRDNGKRAHESRAQTVARRTRWRVGGACRSIVDLLVVKPLRFTGRCLSSAGSKITGLFGGRRRRGGRRR